jgi:hypothetical protein
MYTNSFDLGTINTIWTTLECLGISYFRMIHTANTTIDTERRIKLRI